MTDTPRLGLPEIATGQSDKSSTHNDGLSILDALTQTAVLDKDLTSPPGSPAAGDMYIVGASATGAWATHDGAIAYYRSTWNFYPTSGSPLTKHKGLTAYVRDENTRYTWSGSAWVPNDGLQAANNLSDVASAATSLYNLISGAGSDTAPQLNDLIGTDDVSASTGKKVLVSDLLKVVDLLTEDTTPDRAADFVLTYDTSATAAKKAKPNNLVQKVIIVAVTDETTALTTGTAKLTFRMPFAMTLSGVRGSLTTASGSGLVTVNIKEAGSTIFSTKLTIDAASKTSVGATTPAVLSDTSLADDAEMTIDIDTAGTGATGLKVTLIGKAA